MNIIALERQTVSKKITIDGEYHTRKDNKGFTLSRGDGSFIDELEASGPSEAVLGELVIRINGDNGVEFDEHRRNLGLNVYSISPGQSRACLAFARFVVVKGYTGLPKQLAVHRSGLLDFVACFGLVQDATEQLLLGEVLQLDIKTSKGIYNLSGESMLLITDKVYVSECARRCGISEYLHTNLADIAHVFIGVRPKLVILNCGDFSNEHKRLNITETEYKNILRKHYASVGYKSLDSTQKYVMWKQFS